MNKIVTGIGGVIVAFVVIGLLLFGQQKKNSEGVAVLQNSNVQQNGTDKSTTTGISRYTEYTQAALDKTAHTRRVLFFYAHWCPTCRPTDASFKENGSQIPEDVTVIRVNYNDTDTDQQEKDLASKYGVTYQHTFVQIDDTGNEITKWNGGQLDALRANIK